MAKSNELSAMNDECLECSYSGPKWVVDSRGGLQVPVSDKA